MASYTTEAITLLDTIPSSNPATERVQSSFTQRPRAACITSWRRAPRATPRSQSHADSQLPHALAHHIGGQPKTPAKLRLAMRDTLENAEADLTPQMRKLIDLRSGEWKMIEQQIEMQIAKSLVARHTARDGEHVAGGEGLGFSDFSYEKGVRGS